MWIRQRLHCCNGSPESQDVLRMAQAMSSTSAAQCVRDHVTTTPVDMHLSDDVASCIIGIACGLQDGDDDVRSSLSAVCKSWALLTALSTTFLAPTSLDVCSSGRFSLLKSLSLAKVKLLTTADATRALAALPHLQAVSLRGLPGSFSILRALQHASLTSLDLSGCSKITWQQLAPLEKGLPQLQVLSMAGLKHQVSWANGLAGAWNIDAPPSLSIQAIIPLVRRLKALTLGDRIVGDSVCRMLGTEGTRLTYLDLSGCMALTDAGLASLTTLTALQSISLTSILSFQRAGLASLACLSCLTQLRLQACHQLRDDSIEPLESMFRLQELSLQRCHQLTGACLKSLSSTTSLTSLDVSHCSSLDSLSALYSLPALTTLDVSCCPKLSLPSLSGLTNLTCLHGGQISLHKTECSDSHSTLSDMVSCEGFELGVHTQASLSKLSNLQLLQVLRLPHTLAPAGLPTSLLQAIATLSNLTNLDLSHCGPPVTSTHEGQANDLNFLVPLTRLTLLDLSSWGHLPLAALTSLAGLSRVAVLRLDRFGNAVHGLRSLGKHGWRKITRERRVSSSSSMSSSSSSGHCSSDSGEDTSGSESNAESTPRLSSTPHNCPTEATFPALCRQDGRSSHQHQHACSGFCADNSTLSSCQPASNSQALLALSDRINRIQLSLQPPAVAGVLVPSIATRALQSQPNPFVQASADILGLKAVGDMASLTNLSMRCVSGLTDACLSPCLRAVHHLTALDLSGSSQLTGAGLAALCCPAPSAMCHEPQLAGPATACRSSISLPSSSRPSFRLRALSLTDCRAVSDAGIDQLLAAANCTTSLQSVRKLDLSGCRLLSSRALLALAAAMSGLLHLSLRGNPNVDGSCLQGILQCLPGLKSLEAPLCWRLDDEAVRCVSIHTGLVFVDLSHCCRVSNAALMDLARSRPVLRIVSQGCGRWSPAGSTAGQAGLVL